MTNGNDDGRDVVARMTPLEALLAIEAFGIASTHMLFRSNRGMEMTDILNGMAIRMGEAAGISPDLASRIADRKSPIFVIARELAGGNAEHVSVFLDAKNEKGGKVVVALDDTRYELCDSPCDEKAMDRAQSLSWSDRRSRVVELRDQGFAPFALELVDLLRRIASVDVGFSLEQVFSFQMRRDAVRGDVTQGSVSDRVIQAIANSIDVDIETVAEWTTDVDANVYGRGDVMDVTVRCIAPWEWRDDLHQAVVADLSRERTAPRPVLPAP